MARYGYNGLPRAIPEDVGMSTSRLERIAPVMQGWVDNGDFSIVNPALHDRRDPS